MDNQPSFDRSLLLPIGVALVSLLGTCGILVWGGMSASPGVVVEVPSATAFQYAFIGTEPAISTAVTETVEVFPPLADTAAPSDFFTATIAPPETATPSILFTNTPGSLITLAPIATTGVPSRTPTSAFAAPLSAGTFDDTDNRFVYTGNWKTITGTTYQTTLHTSDTLGNNVKFLFIGNELRVFFQAGPSLGTIRLTLDNTSYVMNEASSTTQNYEWVLAASSVGTHAVTITHDSGGSVNFNYIIVPVVPTTPTNTSTGS